MNTIVPLKACVVGKDYELTKAQRPEGQVEIDAKVFAGYFAGNKKVKTWDELQGTIGRVADDNLKVDKILDASLAA